MNMQELSRMKHGAVPSSLELKQGTMVVYHEYGSEQVHTFFILLCAHMRVCVRACMNVVPHFK
jgi:hypothetical protein